VNIKIKLSLKGNVSHFSKKEGDIVSIPLEDYIKGVVAAEIGNAPIEACKAQAVAARTYAYTSARDGKTITDTGAKDQAFIAARINNRGNYPNALQAVEETAGEVLTYQGQHIGKNAHYSSANNGTTKNKSYRWGGADKPYLVLRADVWTQGELSRRKHANERIRYGHGVGLSQYGAMYAARNGIDYKEILSFYYPGTDITNIGAAKEKEGGGPVSNSKAQLLDKLAREEVGGAYVFAALGEKCTPSNREKYANRKPAHAAAIRGKCQVLNGSKGGCGGCRYSGKRIFDCRGLTSYLLKQATGRYLEGGGATSQWNDNSNWVEKGSLDTLPNKPCVLFNRSKASSSTMAHTGVYLGNDIVVQAGGYGGVGVHIGPLRRDYWTDWAIPVLLYDTGTTTGGENMILARGSRGDKVRELQRALTELNYTFKPTSTTKDGIDGIYGKDTENNVKLFQKNNGLTVDGVWKEAEQNKLEALLKGAAETAETPIEAPIQEGNSENVVITLSMNCAKAIYEALKGVM